MAAGRIKGITIEIGGDTTKLVSALAKVDNAISKTQTNLRDINKALKLDPTNTALLKDKQVELSKAIEDTKRKLDTEKQAYEQLSHADKTPENVEKMRQLKTQIDLDTAALKQLEEQARQSASVLGSQMQAAGEKIKEVGDKVKAVGDKLANFGQRMTTTVTLPIVAAGTKAAQSFYEVDKTMTLTNQTMGSTAEEAKMLNAAMQEAARNSIYSMSDAANATLNFARAGLDAAQAADILAPAMALAAGEGGNLDTVSQGLVGTLNGFGADFNQAAHYADVFANACNNSMLDVDSLSNSMGIAANVFKTAGYSVEDAALYIGVMADKNIEAGEAANALKTGIARLVSPAKQGAEALDALNWSITNADGTMKDTITIQKELHDKFADLSEAEQISAASAIFGKMQMSKWLALINTAPEDVQKLADSIGVNNTAMEMSDAMMEGQAGSILRLKSSLDVLMTSFGQIIAEYIQPLVDKLQELTDKFQAMDEEDKKRIVRIAALVAAIGPVLMIIGKVIIGIGSLIKAVGVITGAIGKLMTIFAGLGGPIGIIIAAIAALVAAFIYFYNTNEEFRNKVNAIWESIKEAFASAFETIKGWFDKFVEWISPIVESVKGALSAIWELVSTIVGIIVNYVKAKIDENRAFIQAALDAIKIIFSTAWSIIKNGVEATLNAIKAIFTGFFDVLKNLAKAFTSLLKGDWKGALDYLKAAAQSGLDAIKNVFNSFKSALSNVFNDLKSAMSRWGKDMIDNLINGIKSKIGEVKNQMANLAGTISSYIHFSEPDVGPLSNFHTYMPDMIKALTQGIDKGIPQIQSAMTNLTGAMVPNNMMTDTMASRSTTNNNSVNITVYGAQGQDVNQLADIIQDRINAQVYSKGAVFA